MSTTLASPDILVSGQRLDVGDVAQVTILTKDASATLADPSTLTVKVKAPGATAVEYVYGTDSELTKSSTGTYVLLHPITAAGTHQVRGITTGNAGAEPGSFFVHPDNTI